MVRDLEWEPDLEQEPAEEQKMEPVEERKMELHPELEPEREPSVAFLVVLVVLEAATCW